MSKYDSPSRPESSPEPFITIHISKRGAVVGVIAVALIAGVGLRLRAHQAPAVAAKAVDFTEETVAPEPTPLATEQPSPSTGERPPVRLITGKPFESAAETQTASGSASLLVRRASERAGAQPPADNSTAAPQPANPTPPVSPSTQPDTSKNVVGLAGAGAEFPYPLYQKWFSKFHEADAQVQIQYQSIGSGGAIQQLLKGTVDFGASDVPMSEKQMAAVRNQILHVPTALRGVVPIYNVPGITGDIRFPSQVLADIYLGKIVWWDDPAIVKENDGRNLPHESIIVVHRSDGNATTFLFTDYLSKVDDAWRSSAGVGTSVKWPKGVGAKGDDGVEATVQQLDGAIGYVDFRFAEEQGLSYAAVQNSAGRFMKASLERLTQAAASMQLTPFDLQATITNAPGSDSYPITGFTWLLVPIRPKSNPRGDAMIAFLGWMLDHGENMTTGLGYAPLPQNVSSDVKQLVAKLQ